MVTIVAVVVVVVSILSVADLNAHLTPVFFAFDLLTLFLAPPRFGTGRNALVFRDVAAL